MEPFGALGRLGEVQSGVWKGSRVDGVAHV